MKGIELSSYIPRGNVVGYKFKIIGDEEIRDRGPKEISSSTITIDKVPHPNGPRSQFLGTESSKHKCLTCDQSRIDCRVGHWGHIKGFPRFNPHKNVMSDTRKILSILCHNRKCYRFVLSPEKMDDEKKNIVKKNKDLLSHLYDIVRSEKGVCYHCKTPVRIIEENKQFPPIMKYSIGTTDKPLYPHDVYELLNQTSEEEFRKYFDNKPSPRSLCTKNMSVCGMPLRNDTISAVNNKPEINELTTAYQIMLKKVIDYGSNTDLTPGQELTEDLKQIYDAYLFLCHYLVVGKMITLTGEHSKNPHILSISSLIGRKFNDIGLSQISGKTRIIREQQLGKRVNNIARVVATCDNSIPFGHVTLPLNILRTLTVAERIWPFNRDRLLVHFVNGDTYPGASTIVRASDGSRLSCEKVKDYYVPQDGDILERHIAPGDLVLIARQPTLMPSNFTAYVVSEKINPESNAMGIQGPEYSQYKDGDFDGDEGPVIAMQGLAGQAELDILMRSHKFLTHVKNGDVVLGLINNSALGIAMLTKNTKISKAELHRLIDGLDNIDDNKYLDLIDSKPPYTGRQIVSLFLPPGVYFKSKPNWYDKKLEDYMNYSDDDKVVIVEDGHLIKGVLDKGTVGGNLSHSLFRPIIEAVGKIKTLTIMHSLRLLSMRALHNSGFTLSIDDITISKESREAITKKIQLVEEEVKKDYKRFDAGEITAEYGETPMMALRRTLQNKTLTMDHFLKDILNGITNWDDNNVVRQMLAVKGNVSTFLKLGSPIGPVMVKGSLLKPTTFGRPSRHCKKNGRTLDTLPYVKGNFALGVDRKDVIVSTPSRILSLVQRINGTAKSGTDRRDRLNAQAVFRIDYYGRLCYGDVDTGMVYAGMSYGSDGLMPGETSSSGLTERFLTSSNKSVFIRYFNVNTGSSEFKKYAERSWDVFDAILTDTRKAIVEISRCGLIEAKYFLRLSVPLNLENHIDVSKDYNLKFAEANFKMAEDTVVRIRNIYNNELEEIKDNFIVVSKLKTITMYMLFCFSPHMLGKIPPHKMRVICEKMFKEYKDAIVMPGYCAGVIAGSTQSKTMVQNSLDAPKKQADTKIIKEETTHDRIFSPRPTLKGDQLYLAPVKAEYRDRIKTLAREIVENRLSEFIINVSVSRGFIKDSKVEEQIEIKADGEEILPLYVTVQLARVQFERRLTTIVEIIDKIEEYDEDIIVAEQKSSHSSISTLVFVFLKPAERGILEGITVENVRSVIHELTDFIIIKGYPHINSAEVMQNTVWEENAEGGIDEKVIPYIKISCDNYYGMFNLPHIEHRYIYCENPNIMVEMFGINAARMAAMLASMRILKTHMTHVMTSIDILFLKGKAIALNPSGQSKRLNKSTLISAVSSDPRGKFVMAATRQYQSPVSDVLSKQLMGQIPRIGTGMCDLFPLPYKVE